MESETSITLPEFSELYDASTGRAWPREAADRFVVGCIHGSYDLTQSCLHLGLAYESFADVTETELQGFLDDVLPLTSILLEWSSRDDEDSEVQRLLEDIKTLMNEAQEFFGANYADFKLVECVDNAGG